jgi:putative endonuclease
MSRSYSFYVYILTNQQKSVLYTGVTNNLHERIITHWKGSGEPQTFTGRYRAHFLLYYEAHAHVDQAISREKEIKGWVRRKKCDLISGFNPEWKFLNEEVFGEWPPKYKL